MNFVKTQSFSTKTGERIALLIMATTGLVLPLHSQQASSGPSANGVSTSDPATPVSASPQKAPQEILLELDAMKKRIEELEAQLKQRGIVEPIAVTTAAKATETVATSANAPAALALSAAAVSDSAAAPEKKAKAEPFAFADWTWLNGNPRTK